MLEVRFAVIGDFGTGGASEASVAKLVASWDPEFIVSLGDNYYAEAGGEGSRGYDKSVGEFYCRWLKDVSVTRGACPWGRAGKNSFFPTLGNHDITDALPGPESYLEYFTLPGKGFETSSSGERYYDFRHHPLHFFILNSNDMEPDGVTAQSRQAMWLKTQLGQSTAPWKIVVGHHPPYSSDNSHGSAKGMRWPFGLWGADVVMSGHSHSYERLHRDGVVYFVNGLGGAALYGFADSAETGSQARYSANWGAQLVTVTEEKITFEFRSVSGELIDRHTMSR